MSLCIHKVLFLVPDKHKCIDLARSVFIRYYYMFRM